VLNNADWLTKLNLVDFLRDWASISRSTK